MFCRCMYYQDPSVTVGRVSAGGTPPTKCSVHGQDNRFMRRPLPTVRQDVLPS